MIIRFINGLYLCIQAVRRTGLYLLYFLGVDRNSRLVSLIPDNCEGSSSRQGEFRRLSRPGHSRRPVVLSLKPETFSNSLERIIKRINIHFRWHRMSVIQASLNRQNFVCFFLRLIDSNTKCIQFESQVDFVRISFQNKHNQQQNAYDGSLQSNQVWANH